MIVEVRSYRIKPGHRDAFIHFFETRAVPALRTHGMQILGPLLDLENPNKFVWLRSFPKPVSQCAGKTIAWSSTPASTRDRLGRRDPTPSTRKSGS